MLLLCALLQSPSRDGVTVDCTVAVTKLSRCYCCVRCRSLQVVLLLCALLQSPYYAGVTLCVFS